MLFPRGNAPPHRCSAHPGKISRRHQQLRLVRFQRLGRFDRLGPPRDDGDHDESDPGMSKEMHEKIAGSELVIVPKSGHMTFVDQPNLFIKTVSEFVNAK